MNGVLGRNTRILDPAIPFSEAERLYEGHRLLVLDPLYDKQTRVVGGLVAAVSRTDAGLQRAIRAMPAIQGRFRAVRLFA